MRRITLVVVTLVVYIIVANGLLYAGDQGILSKLFVLLGLKIQPVEEIGDGGTMDWNLKENPTFRTTAVDPFPKPPIPLPLPDTTK